MPFENRTAVTTLYDACKTCGLRLKKPSRYRMNCKTCKKRIAENLSVGKNPAEDELNFSRDIQWAYRNMGRTDQAKDAPSDAAKALLDFANEHRKEFVARFMAWNQKREEARGTTAEEMKEDADKTRKSLEKLMFDLQPDIETIILDASNVFPDQFRSTLTKLGWIHRRNIDGGHARPERAYGEKPRYDPSLGPLEDGMIEDDDNEDDGADESPAFQEEMNAASEG